MENFDKVYAEKIAEEYTPKEESKVKKLEKLDNKVKKLPFIVSLIVGIGGALILGTGMSFIMTDIGPKGDLKIILGTILGIIGIIINYLTLNFIKKQVHFFAVYYWQYHFSRVKIY